MAQSKKRGRMPAVLAVALASAMLVGGGTFAYLQSSTGDVVNEFNANQVAVELIETTGGNYEIIPGTSQTKDPTVTVDNSIDAYVFVRVNDTTDGLVTYEIESGWTLLDGYTNVYYREVTADAANKEFAVLEGNTVFYDASLENSDMLDAYGNLKDGIDLAFKAYAIQKQPFDGNMVLAYGYASGTAVATSDDIQQAIDDANAAGEPAAVVLTEDINLDSAVTLKAENGITIAGDEITVTGSPIHLASSGNVMISGVNFSNGNNGNESAIYVTNKDEIDQLVIENCSFKDAKWDSIQLTNPNIDSIIIRNNTFENTEKGYRYIHLELRNPGYVSADTKLVITGNTFINVSGDYCSDSAITIAGFYFENMDITDNYVMGAGADALTSSMIWICNGTNFGQLYTADQIEEAFQYVALAEDASGLLASVGQGQSLLLAEDIRYITPETVSATKSELTLANGDNLDLGDNTLMIESPEGYGGFFLKTEGAEATLKNGTIVQNLTAGTNNAVVNADKATLILENMTITAEKGLYPSTGTYAVCVTGYEGSKVIMRNCNINGDVIVGSGGTLIAENCTINGKINLVTNANATLTNTTYGSLTGSGKDNAVIN